MHRRAARRRRTQGADSGHSWDAWEGSGGEGAADAPQRSALRRPQTAEQLVDVPTEPGYSLAVIASKLCSRREIRRILSGLGSTASGFGQVVGNPVPQGRGGCGARGGLQGSRAGQNSPAYLEQIVGIPVLQGRRGSGGGLEGLRAGQDSTAVDVERIFDSPVPQCRRRSSGSPQGSLPGRGSTANVEQIVDIPARGGLQGFSPRSGFLIAPFSS